MVVIDCPVIEGDLRLTLSEKHWPFLSWRRALVATFESLVAWSIRVLWNCRPARIGG